MNGPSELTISIVSHNHGDLLRALLSDLDRLESLRSAHVLVTLNVASEQLDTRQYERLRIQVIRNAAPKGFTANHNQAFASCTTQWFVVMNPDIRMPEDSFVPLLAAAAADPQIALVAPVVLDGEGRVEDSVRANLSPWSISRRVFLRRRQKREDPMRSTSRGFQWFAGMFLLLKASAYRAVNGFDERYFLYCEDYDLCARLHLSGFRLKLEPDARVIHLARRDSHRSMQHLKWHMRSLLRVWLSGPMWRIAFRSQITE